MPLPPPQLPENPPRPNRRQRLRRIIGFLLHWLAEARGALVLAMVALLVQRIAGFTAPALTKVVVDDVLGAKKLELLAPIALALFASALLQAAAGFVMAKTLLRSSEQLIAKLRTKVHAHVLGLPIAFFHTSRKGQLAHRVLHEARELEAFAGPFLLEIAGASLTALFALAVLLFLDPVLTLVVVALLLAIAVISVANLRHAFAHSREQNRLEAELSGRLAESFSAIRVVKAFRTEARERELFGAGIGRLFELTLRGSRASMRIAAISTALFGGATALIVYLAASRVLEGTMSLGEMVTFLACLGFLIAPLLQISTMAPGVLRALSAMERTMDLLELRKEGADDRERHQLTEMKGEIVFENVSFGYGDNLVLRDIAFRTEPGQVTAIVGPSGAGKTTLLALLAGFHEPSAGRILVDGRDLESLSLASYRSHLALVPQESPLFDGTIRENVALAKPSATDAEIHHACRVAGVSAFVEPLPTGYETRVGDLGANVSAGQRQRIAIARAFLKNPTLLLLDEPTSALDSESERLIEPVLASREGRTTIVVSHRVSTIRRADQVLVLDEGRIVERGTHASLMALRGRYFRIFGDEVETVPQQVKAS